MYFICCIIDIHRWEARSNRDNIQCVIFPYYTIEFASDCDDRFRTQFAVYIGIPILCQLDKRSDRKSICRSPATNYKVANISIPPTKSSIVSTCTAASAPPRTLPTSTGPCPFSSPSSPLSTLPSPPTQAGTQIPSKLTADFADFERATTSLSYPPPPPIDIREFNVVGQLSPRLPPSLLPSLQRLSSGIDTPGRTFTLSMRSSLLSLCITVYINLDRVAIGRLQGLIIDIFDLC
jgi:hypothetical protein